MGLFFLSEAPASPMPPTPVSAADRLIGLLQDGRSLERYVEDFVELAFLTNWSDACLNTLFLEGLDESTIRFDEPDDYVSLNDTINLILYLNGSDFVVEEVLDVTCISRPVPPETRAAWPVRQSPSSSTYPSSELFPCVLPDSQPSVGSGRSKRRKRKKAKRPKFPEFSTSVQPKSPEFSASVQSKSPEFSASVQPKPPEFPASEPAPVPVGLLIVYEGMSWTPFPDPSPAFNVPTPAAAEPAPAVAVHEPTPAQASTPFLRLFKLLLNPLKYFFWGGLLPVGGEYVGGVSTDIDPPWPPTDIDPPWPPKAPDLPWPSMASDPPWRPPCPSVPLPAPA
ncbi:hypothetical protein DPX16_20515 [Anabarilius grahami]|uniref:Retrotransposon gag domain-containing protein n=1 Tax=Anabarilius grahami TaxID=495550 RepID=A0A3N0YL11_ANAGA|nr:hypothetical protein DPX16_20515 [Anabarilius grahami]